MNKARGSGRGRDILIFTRAARTAGARRAGRRIALVGGKSRSGDRGRQNVERNPLLADALLVRDVAARGAGGTGTLLAIALRAVVPLGTFRTIVTLGAIRTRGGFRTIIALETLSALRPIVAIRAFGPIGALVAARTEFAAGLLLAALLLLGVAGAAFAGLLLLLVLIVVIIVIGLVVALAAMLVEAAAALAQNPEIMIRILQIGLGQHPIALHLGVAGEAFIFFVELGGIAALAIVLAIAGAGIHAARRAACAAAAAAAPAAALSIIDQAKILTKGVIL